MLHKFSLMNVEQQLKPHIDQLYGDGDVIWQCNGDSKHRFHYVLEQIDEIFNDGVKPEEQADKMADI
ncbi:unnamed protein product [Rotaria sordida]|uniref:Uncharacterized protein n=1 Tax=Rotaria sordida TaxID=392033 RepID=A0A813Y704_9BILA|nr:unnamed protein product [Rotaria sordida]CAF0932923.1 unnamed protein product [Rotaria sordida]CAF0997426.1 unnamed protein product [Rotaria sordida]CAF1161957.1 unnamed protein product [Rotaria sordida]CAF3671112.1 unnamed protein product [Rotaria sordida]